MDKFVKKHMTSILLMSSLLALPLSIQPVAAAGCQALSKSTLESKADPYGKSIRSASHKYGVHEDLVKAVITVESCFRSTARGTSGEKGLMQLMPATARRFSVKSGYNPWQNIHGGTRYLSYLLKRYNGDAHRAVAAYNAGEGNVRPGGRIRNKAYVSKVMSAYGKFAGSSRQRIFSGNQASNTPNIETMSVEKTSRTSRTARQATSNRALPWRDKSRTRQRNQKQERANRSQSRQFQVKQGHTVYEVMRQSGIPVKQIISLNKLRAPYHLQSGQTLKLR